LSTPASGLVRFTSDGAIIPGCAAVLNVAGAATCTTSFTTATPRVIVAIFLGDGLYGPSTSAPLTQTLTRTPTTTVVIATPNPGEPEQPVTFTATVSPGDATGDVTFSVDGVEAGSAPLAGGEAVFVHPGFEPGTRQVTASYSGTSDTYNGSISAQAQFTTGRYHQSFAEGSTGFFRTQIGLFNTSAAGAADVRMTLYPETGSAVALELTLDPLARRSFDLHALIGSVSGVSTRIESTKPIAATRQMTWGTPVQGSTLESGIAETSTQWYFAEGATNAFSLFYLVQNPGSTPAQVTFTHLLEGGAEPVTKTETVPAHARRTFLVNALPGLASAALSTAISSDVPIVAERAMYLNLARPLDAGTVSRGATALGTSWSLAEGATGFFHTYLLLGNPGADAAIATVRYLLSDSTVIERQYTIAPHSRLTVDVKQEAPALAAATFGITLTSTLPIVAERAMWWGEPVWYEGSVSLGSMETGTVWGIGEGTEGGASNDATFVLVANTSATDGVVRFTVSYDDGTTERKEFAVAANARLTVRMVEEFAKTAGQRFSVLVESLTTGVPIAVESASYQSPNGVFGTSGGSAPATRVR
jgi:hypothetical protein